MFCSKCGAEIENDGDFCTNCGEKINKDSSQKTENENAPYKSPIQITGGSKFDLRIILVTSVVVALTYIILEVIITNVTTDHHTKLNLLKLFYLIAGLIGGFLFNRLNHLEHNYINNIMYCVFGIIIIMLYYGLTDGNVGNLGTQITAIVIILIGSFIGDYLERNALY